MKGPRPETKLSKAIPFMVAAAFFNTWMIFFVKISTQFLPVSVVLFARCLITLIIISPFLYFNPAKQPILTFLKTDRKLLHFVRDFAGLISLFCYFFAAKTISLADATLLFNTSPLFIPIVSYFWGGFKIIHRLWWGMALGFVGILLILHPGHELFSLASFVGLLSGLTAAIVFVGSRYLLYSEPPLRNMFYYFALGAAVTFVLVLFSHVSWADFSNIKTILFLLSIGIFGYLYQLCFTYSAKLGPVRLTSSFMYVSVIFSMVLDWFFWKIKPDMLSFLGILCVVLGACLLLLLYPKDDFQKR